MSGAAALYSCFTFLAIVTFFTANTTSIDTIAVNGLIASDQTLASANDVFQLGFFTLDNAHYYVGIWYKNIPDRTYVWVANRDTPVANSSSAVFKIGDKGNNVVILDQANKTILWSSNQTRANSSPVNPVARLLDNGNLVIREAGDESNSNYLWQSFDFPTDTLLSEMKLGWDLTRGLNRFLNSWKTPQDPSSGDFSFKIDYHGYPEIFLWDKSTKLYRSGPWNGIRFSGVPEMQSSSAIDFTFVSNQQQVYYSFELNTPNIISRLTMNSTGTLQRFTWVEDSKSWSMFWEAPKDQCDHFSECGPYGICDTNASPVCNCTPGFSPKNLQAWNMRDGSAGCVRRTDLNCSSDGFLLFKGMKLPESSNTIVDMEMSLDDCQKGCAKNCSCTGYSSANISNGEAGCVMWFGDLLDMRHYVGGGQDFYVKLSASDIVAFGGLVTQNSSSNGLGTLAIVGIAAGGSVLLLAFTAFLMWKRKTSLNSHIRNTEQQGARERSQGQDFLLNEVVSSSKRDYTGENKPEVLELPLFAFNAIALATKNFSDENKLGQGGFGSVYQCRIEEGPVVAVKRLSKNSGQGVEEFKNEVQLIARLQHRNLVRLIGCCVEMDEKILIYEYMEHKSLDSVLFSKTKSSMLNWERRFNIICGIARGLLYLHQDSRFRIIHRDLKASNILLDRELNPKISDFGMARIFGRDQVEANTKRVVGTYGYMAPEYAMDGLFSEKSDVFSFGVLVLEIVSGKKNRGFYYPNDERNLLEHSWKFWKEGNGLELLDSAVGDAYSMNEVLRCIQVGLLCVQERANDRPVMLSVVLMLSSENPTMPHPKIPGFRLGRAIETDSSSSKHDGTCTVNQVTVTMPDAR
ncbi:hypothetical protein ACJRO7_017469 [Eucalyptus globulus]|uniref:Receptor-like serine/threonine-protein kinase n=1 Tax=Eucalyptus globulus TaxID=34317 RepID=A0ABD3KR38_EUCGL